VSPASAQHANPAEREKILDEFQEISQRNIEKLRKLLFSDLDASDAEIYSQIEFRTPRTDYPDLAWATVRNGKPIVEIDVGFLRSLPMNVDALVMEQSLSRPGLFVRYARYVARSLKANRARMAKGERPAWIMSPYEFVGMSDREMDEFDDNPKLLSYRHGAFANAMAFVLAHEVGHHVLGHAGRRAVDGSKARQWEREADAWAIKVLARHGVMPIGGMVPLLMDLATTTEQAQIDQDRSHPTDEQRVRAMVAGSIEALPLLHSLIQQSGKTEAEVRSEIERLGRLGADMRNDSAASAPDSVTTDEHSPRFCRQLEKIIDASGHRFRAITGEPDPRGNGEAWTSTVKLDEAQECVVWLYRDRDLDPDCTCTFGRSHDTNELENGHDNLVGQVRSCLPSWRVRERDSRIASKETMFSSDGGTRVRVLVTAPSGSNRPMALRLIVEGSTS
jgi:hypothetical protein